jgi:hypothetical protein
MAKEPKKLDDLFHDTLKGLADWLVAFCRSSYVCRLVRACFGLPVAPRRAAGNFDARLRWRARMRSTA